MSKSGENKKRSKNEKDKDKKREKRENKDLILGSWVATEYTRLN